jgi:alpha-tubulin suppressor-like RCC1 family protein
MVAPINPWAVPYLSEQLPLEMLAHVCRHLGLRDLARVAATCKRLRHGGTATVERPTRSPVINALGKHAFARPELVPSMRPIGCSESWVGYLARCALHRCCLEAPSVAAGNDHSVILGAGGRLLTCGKGVATGHGDAGGVYPVPTPVVAMAGIRVRSVAAACDRSLALSWDGRIYTWGANFGGILGLGDTVNRPSPTLVEGLAGVCSIAAGVRHSLAATQSGQVFHWGMSLGAVPAASLRVQGFGGVRVRRMYADMANAYAVGEDGQLFSWEILPFFGLVVQGGTPRQFSPTLVHNLRGVRVSSVAGGTYHAVALAEDGLVYSWGQNEKRILLGGPQAARQLPTPIEALRGVRVVSIAAIDFRSYAVADTGEVWAWGWGAPEATAPLGLGGATNCRLPKLIKSLRGIKVEAVATGTNYTLALADDGRVYAWGSKGAAASGALGLDSPWVQGASWWAVQTPQRVPEVRVACGL